MSIRKILYDILAVLISIRANFAIFSFLTIWLIFYYCLLTQNSHYNSDYPNIFHLFSHPKASAAHALRLNYHNKTIDCISSASTTTTFH